mgnify:CR=1 FL=1
MPLEAQSKVHGWIRVGGYRVWCDILLVICIPALATPGAIGGAIYGAIHGGVVAEPTSEWGEAESAYLSNLKLQQLISSSIVAVARIICSVKPINAPSAGRISGASRERSGPRALARRRLAPARALLVSRTDCARLAAAVS